MDILHSLKSLLFSGKRIQQVEISYAGKTALNYSNIIKETNESNQIFSNVIIKNKPTLIGRLGASELKALNNYIVKGLTSDGQIILKNEIINELFTHSGVFPPTTKTFENFCQEYIKSIKEIDHVGIWNNVGEPLILNLLCPKASLFKLQALEPFFSNDPWTKELKHKNVLVIHPFSESIKKQYASREKLFNHPEILPEFNLITLQATQSLSQNEDDSLKDWLQALDIMKKQISSIDFDIAIIGAGAYGLPLGAHIKSIGKIAFHLGGVTQILFGIRGKRWDQRTEYQKLFNGNWIYPSENEMPEKGNLADGIGPYWK